MPLTFEEFKELRAQGLSDDQIHRFEAGEKPNAEVAVQQPEDNAPRSEWESYYKQTVKPSGNEQQITAGLVEGVQNLPFGRRIIPEGSTLSDFAQSIPQPTDVGQSFQRGVGQIAPGFAPIIGVGKGVSMLAQAPKLAALASPGAHMAATMGGYEALRSAANQEGNPLVEGAKGAVVGAGMGKLAQFGANLMPRQVIAAERIGSALGGGVAQAGIEQVMNPDSPTHDRIASALLGGALMGAMPARRKADLDALKRAQMMDITIRKTMDGINMRPPVTGKTGTTLNQAKDKLASAWYNVWNKGKPAFTGKDGTPENTQEVVNAIDLAKNEAIKDMKIAEETSFLKADVQGVERPIQKFILDGNELARSLRSSLTSNKKLLEATGDYDIQAIRKRVAGLKDKSFTITEVDGLLKELNRTYGKTTVQAKIDRELADTLRAKTEEMLDSVDKTAKGTAGKMWRQARRNWGALRELEAQFLKIHNKYSNTPEGQPVNTELGTRIAAGAQTGMGFMSGNPAQTAVGAIELALSKYRSMTASRSKLPMEKIKNMFRELDRQNNLRTLNQEMSDLYAKKEPIVKKYINENLGAGLSTRMVGGVENVNFNKAPMAGAIKSKPQDFALTKEFNEAKQVARRSAAELIRKASEQEIVDPVASNKAIKKMPKKYGYQIVRDGDGFYYVKNPNMKLGGTAGLGLGIAGSAVAASDASAKPPSDEEAIKAILGEVGPYGKEGMQYVASALRNRNNGVKGVYGSKNPNVVNKKYTQKQYDEAKQAWEDSKKKSFTDADHWFSDADLKQANVKKMIKDGNMKFIRKVGGNSFYKANKKPSKR